MLGKAPRKLEASDPRNELIISQTVTSPESSSQEDLDSWMWTLPSCSGPFIFSDVLDYKNLREIVVNNNISWLVHFAAVLSAVGESSVSLTRNVNLEVTCSVDLVHQAIANDWPMVLEDSAARRDWGWKHEFDLPELVQIMLAHITTSSQLAQAN